MRAMNEGGEVSAEIVEDTRREVVEQLKMHLKPEFLNRIDEIVLFEPLSRSDINQIVDMQLQSLRKLLSHNGIELNYTEQARDLIATIGYDPVYGARPVKRTIQREVVGELSKRILAGQVNREHPITISADNNSLLFSN